MENEKKIAITMKLSEWNLIINKLSTQKYSEVYTLIAEIQVQASKQLNEVRMKKVLKQKSNNKKVSIDKENGKEDTDFPARSRLSSLRWFHRGECRRFRIKRNLSGFFCTYNVRTDPSTNDSDRGY